MDCIVFYCKDCGSMFFASVNDPKYPMDKDTAKEIASYLQEGHIMKTITDKEVRENFGGCRCGESKQLDLFQEAV